MESFYCKEGWVQFFFAPTCNALKTVVEASVRPVTIEDQSFHRIESIKLICRATQWHGFHAYSYRSLVGD